MTWLAESKSYKGLYAKKEPKGTGFTNISTWMIDKALVFDSEIEAKTWCETQREHEYKAVGVIDER